jgi:nicotinamide-nucleotide amidase
VESCTGGFLANRITHIPGSGDVFREGFVTYSDHAKAKMLGVPGHLLVEHGAVSEPVAKEMAERGRVHADVDFALSTTGFAGPNGGVEDKPVGTVFIGLATKSGTHVQKFIYPYDRETFKFVTSQTALNMLRKELLAVS